MNMKFLLYFFSLPFFAVGMDPSRLSSKRSHVPVLNRCSPHLIVRSGGAAKIQRLSGGGLNSNRDRIDEVGVKKMRNGWCPEVYTLCGDAVASLSRVMRCLGSCPDLICRGIQPTTVRYMCVPPFATCVCHRSSGCRGFFVLSMEFCEECLCGGHHFCRVVTFRKVN